MIWSEFWYGAALASFIMVLVFQSIDAGRFMTAGVALWGLFSTVMLGVAML